MLGPDGAWPRLIPELEVLDLEASVRFYRDAGFEVSYRRPAEGFVMLVHRGVALMLEAADGPGRRFSSAPLERPLGRGVNLQIQVDDVVRLRRRLGKAGHRVVLELEQRWYPVGDREAGNHQFVVADPDGYLLRFFEDLGTRPVQPVAEQ
jgi:catechol 2,3-dioxygenase-like lactoylglutathione lyase family enzyme